MPHIVGSPDHPDDLLRPKLEWNIRINVSEEYLGYVMGEVNSHGGVVKNLEATEGKGEIRAALPALEFQAIGKVLERINGLIRREAES